MNKLTIWLRKLWIVLYFEFSLRLTKTKRSIWNRGIKLKWDRLWIRKNEFHNSLSMDVDAIYDMSTEERNIYIKNLIKRRNLAHKKSI